ncbi:helix-turn-helix domain-containing protein [Promicromonospora sp. Populi]|uniref:helix-turn-helix domain-containing protein n=1 Tax=Promicromonospora sp. Populi TaxID=3239420 RepID=UPI0034E2D0B0
MAVLEVETADAWEDVVSSCFVPLNCLGFEPAFHGRMAHAALDAGLSVSLVTTSGTSAERSARLAAHAGSDDLHLSLQRSATGLVCAGGQRVAVRSGSVSVYATDAPYYLDYSAPGQQQLIVQVSRSSLGLPRDLLDAARRRLAVPGLAAARTLFGFVAGQVPGGVGADLWVADAAVVARDLAVAMLRSSFATAPVLPRTPDGLRVAVLDFVRENAAEPTLDVDGIARRHYVSRRRLYDLFEALGTTPGEHLRAVRLRAAAERLADPADLRTVADIGYACGFDDATTFTRAFRRVFGVTPREFRAG